MESSVRVLIFYSQRITVRGDRSTSGEIGLVSDDDDRPLPSIMFLPQIVEYPLGHLEAGTRDDRVHDDTGVRLVRRQGVFNLRSQPEESLYFRNDNHEGRRRIHCDIVASTENDYTHTYTHTHTDITYVIIYTVRLMLNITKRVLILKLWMRKKETSLCIHITKVLTVSCAYLMFCAFFMSYWCSFCASCKSSWEFFGVIKRLLSITINHQSAFSSATRRVRTTREIAIMNESGKQHYNFDNIFISHDSSAEWRINESRKMHAQGLAAKLSEQSSVGRDEMSCDNARERASKIHFASMCVTLMTLRLSRYNKLFVRSTHRCTRRKFIQD